MTTDRTEQYRAFSAMRGLTGRAVIMPHVDALIDKLAGDLLVRATERIAAASVFHLALSGGSTPRQLYQALVIDPQWRNFPWPDTHVWVVDERCVSFDDDRSNFHMMKQLLLDHVGIPPSHIHAMPVTQPGGDHAYEADLRNTLPVENEHQRLDFALLGMGDDGHTASLFPHSPAQDQPDRLVVFNSGDTVAEPRPRMTMTYTLLNAARNIAMLVTGSAKHAMLQHVALLGDDNDAYHRLPVTGIRPTFDDADLTWYLDYPAALGDAG